MGQMGNSEEATMSDDMPFDMADLIVVGGQGEPMEFAEGGFVPQRETLQTAAVPTMGGGTTGGTTTTPIVYDDFMKTPVVTMQEYRDANGNSIIITSVNGKATTAVPEGYTLYTPPANTAPSTIQAAIQTVNRRSYRPTGSDEGPDPQPDQPAPDYGSMDDNDYFNAMAEQNSFGGKVGSAAATAIGFMIGGPVGLLVSTLMRNDKNNQIASMKGRIDGMQPGSAKDRAQAIYDEYRGETDPEKKQGLFSRVTDYLGGIVGDVAGAIGISQEDAAKVTRNATVAEINGTTIDVEQALTAPATIPVNVTPTADQTRPQLRPDEFPTVSDTIKKYPKGNVVPDQIASPLGNVLSAEANQGMVPALARTSTPVIAKDPVGYGIGQVDPRLAAAQVKAQEEARSSKYKLQNEVAKADAYDTLFTNLERSEQAKADAARERSLNMPGASNQNVSKSKIKQDKNTRSGIGMTSPSRPEDFEDRVNESGQALNSMEGQMNQLGSLGDRYKGRVESGDIGSSFTGEAGNQYAFDSNRANDAMLANQADDAGRFDQAEQAPERIVEPFVPPPANITFPGMDIDNRDTMIAGSGVDAMALANVPPAGLEDPRQAGTSFTPSQTQQAFGVPTAGTGGYDQLPSMGNTMGPLDRRRGVAPVTSMSGIEPYNPSVEPKERSMYEYPVQETAAQRRAKEAATQRARIQTRNKEIVSATALIPARIANSKQTQDSIKAGYTGSTTGGYAIGKISGSDGNKAGVVQRADGKVTKVRDLDSGATGQRAGMTVFSDADGVRFTKSTFGKKTKLNGDSYEGPGITRQDKGLGNTFFQSTANVLTPGDGKSYVDGELVNDSGSGGSSSTKTYSSLAEAAKDGQHGQSVNIAGKGVQKVKFGDASYDAKMKAESDKADDGGSDDSKIVCTEMYRQTQLVDWQHTMKIWHVYQEKYLTPYHQIGYHWLFKPYVKGMKKSSLLTKLGATLAKHRTEHLRYILTKGKSKDNLVGNVWCKFVHPLVYVAGIFKQKIGK